MSGKRILTSLLVAPLCYFQLSDCKGLLKFHCHYSPTWHLDIHPEGTHGENDSRTSPPPQLNKQKSCDRLKNGLSSMSMTELLQVKTYVFHQALHEKGLFIYNQYYN